MTVGTMSQQFEFKNINCPICGCDDSRLLGWRGGDAHHNGSGVKTAVVRCAKCTHQYPNPMPFPMDLNELYTGADDYFKGHSVERKKQLGLDLIAKFEAKLGRKGRFLDIGCAAGEFLWAAKEAGWDYDGVDPSEEFIELGRKYHGVEGKACLLEEAKFPDEHFDAITMSSVLEHIYAPCDLLIEVRRILKPGGIFWFDAPNEDGLYMRAGNLYMKIQRKDWVVTMAPTFPPFHVQGFNPESLKHLLKRTNFILDELNIFGGVWEFTGKKSFRKTMEFKVAKVLTWFSNKINQGPYMEVWSRKASDPKV